MKFPRGLTTFFQNKIQNDIQINNQRYSDLVQSIHKDGLGYRRIAKVLNERGLTTEEGHIWKSPNVYSVIRRYSERLERLKFRRNKYPLVRGKMWMEFTK